MNKTKHVFASVLLVIFITSCASKVQEVLNVDGKYEDVFNASVQAITDINYAVVRANITTGFIVGEYGSFTSSKTVVNLNVMVTRTPTGIEVKVAIVPRPGVFTIGEGVEEHLRDFKKSLKRKFPSITVD